MNTKMRTTRPELTPASRLNGLSPYSPPPRDPRIVLSLAANEGPACRDSIVAALRTLDPESLRRYPDASALEERLADRWRVDPSRVVVTNGGDDAIDRICRSALEPGRRALLHDPTFVMIERSARLAGADVIRVPWVDGGFPVDPFVSAITEDTALVSIVTPNNPTGGVIGPRDICTVAEAAARVGALVLVDLAYVEFAEHDPTQELVGLPNVVLVRTFSKAMGLAGLRVGYAVASTEIACWMRTVGGPFPVSAASLLLAAAALDTDREKDASIERIKIERRQLAGLLEDAGAEPLASQANFVTARFEDPELIRARLATCGIAVRLFGPETSAAGLVRITLPGKYTDFQRLTNALKEALS